MHVSLFNCRSLYQHPCLNVCLSIYFSVWFSVFCDLEQYFLTHNLSLICSYLLFKFCVFIFVTVSFFLSSVYLSALEFFYITGASAQLTLRLTHSRNVARTPARNLRLSQSDCQKKETPRTPLHHEMRGF